MNHQEQYFSDKAPPFGKYQRIVAIAIFMAFQLMLYVSCLLPFYAIITLNYQMMIFLFAVSLFQSFARRSQAFIDFVNDVLQLKRYSKGLEVIFEEPIKDTNKCLFGLHPHGVLSAGMTANMNTKSGPFSNIAGLSSRMMLFSPFTGFLLRLWGVQSVDSQHMKSLMKQGRNICLLPGGFEEATITSQRQLRIFIKNRKGFIKYAMENNYSIYPMAFFREHQAFWTFDYFTDFRLFLNKLKLPGVIFFNPQTLFFLPPKLECYTIIGKKINYRQLQAGQAPTQGEIDKVHRDYIEQFIRIYEKYKHLNGNVPLKIY